ncbi:RluA family pseudouridine synthase [uncultured Algibacter sp.]|uniref:RluA family pseudouridine synthase n=1 Tax=uncultured Algibacter sp. TaxID=298659 RepID=UPI00262E7C04|nr:RluA family pseudouridine synthase [uncultured Algibacter sp.]
MPKTKFTDTFFHEFEVVKDVTLPKQFTFPFYYEPHKLSVLAAEDLQRYLEMQSDFKHNFGLHPKMKGLQIGKMFGVMVVQNTAREIGYLAAFSGKLAENNHHKGFVPTVYDTLDKNGFYKKGEAELNRLSSEIEFLEQAHEFKSLKYDLNASYLGYDKALLDLKTLIKAKKHARKLEREQALELFSEDEYKLLDDTLKQQSIHYNLRLRDLKAYWSNTIETLKLKIKHFEAPIEVLKAKRAKLSASLQKRLHEQYRFLNAKGETKDLLDIFKDTASPIPPAASGECAAPKLFQYAYECGLKPIAMAEFWWGASPKSEVRKHKQFYPSCRSKCEPILGHMMKGLDVENNPILEVKSHNQPLEIVYEDDYLLLVNKPHDFLSVPGKTTLDSVYTKMKQYLPNAKGPLLVHRLDMSTSGLLLVAKNERTYKKLQKQFIERSVKKRYVAVLDGEISKKEGIIDLPLRVDLDNRPQQLVCYEHGKPAKTKYEVVDVVAGKTRIHFYPISGRTHQLRVHAAHVDGLNTPIIGDDLYGVKGERLYLHAAQLTFIHPVTLKVLDMICEAPF